MIFIKFSCSATPQLSLWRPKLLIHHLWWSIGPPLRLFRNCTHHFVVRGPGTPQSSKASSWTSLATSLQILSLRPSSWKVTLINRASAEASRPGYFGMSSTFNRRMEYHVWSWLQPYITTNDFSPIQSHFISSPSNALRLNNDPFMTLIGHSLIADISIHCLMRYHCSKRGCHLGDSRNGSHGSGRVLCINSDLRHFRRKRKRTNPVRVGISQSRMEDSLHFQCENQLWSWFSREICSGYTSPSGV